MGILKKYMQIDHFVPLQFSSSALGRLAELQKAAEESHICLRIYIVGGGCSGFQYGFSFDKTEYPDDTIIKLDLPPEANQANSSQASCVVDAMSLPYLVGSTVDYVKNLQGARFVITNPQAQSTCGCGSSFSLAEG